MAQTIDCILCLFPFEVAFFNGSGLEARFVGHPLADTLGQFRSDGNRDENLVALLPGSRDREIEKIFPVMLDAAKDILKIEPRICFSASAASEKGAQKMKAMVSNRMRHFLQLDPDSTTLYFKDHQNSIKDKSTMKNALGYKFEKKKKRLRKVFSKSLRRFSFLF